MPKAAATKKTKADIAKSASKKNPAKKWTKGKVKEKSDHAVFLDQATHDKILTAIPKLGKHISLTLVVEKFKVVGSVARVMLRKAVNNGSIRATEVHSKQSLFTPTQAVADKPAETKAGDAKKGKKK